MSDVTIPLIGFFAGVFVTVCAVISVTPGIIILAPVGAVFAFLNLAKVISVALDH